MYLYRLTSNITVHWLWSQSTVLEVNTQSEPSLSASVLFSSNVSFLHRLCSTEPTGAVASREPPLCCASTAHPQGEASAMRARLGDAAACRLRASGSQRPWCARAGRFWKMCSVGAQDGLNGAKCRSLRTEPHGRARCVVSRVDPHFSRAFRPGTAQFAGRHAREASSRVCAVSVRTCVVGCESH